MMKILKYYTNCQNVTKKHKVSKCCWKGGAIRLAPCKVPTNLQLKQNAIKHSMPVYKINFLLQFFIGYLI